MTAHPQPPLTPDEREDYEERAAIVQESTGMTRQQAEAWAMVMVLAKRKLLTTCKA